MRAGYLVTFSPEQIETVNEAVSFAEELVSNAYKMSASQWLRRRYDIKTLNELKKEEIVHGPFAQIVRYEGHHTGACLGSSTYDYYIICIQDHSILQALTDNVRIQLYPFALYISTHELIHIVRFSAFLQNFSASTKEMIREESRVHAKTHAILSSIQTRGLSDVLAFYAKWRCPENEITNR